MLAAPAPHCVPTYVPLCPWPARITARPLARVRPPAPPAPQVLGTVEGKEGLLVALQEAARQDSTLALQLKLLL